MFMIPFMLEWGKFVSETTSSKDTFFGGKEIGNHKTMKLYLLLLVTILSFDKLYAQSNVDWCNQLPPNVSKGGFTVNNSNAVVRGCAPFKVTVQNTSAISDKYIYDYKGGDPTLPNSGYVLEDRKDNTYLKQGTYRILQLGSGTSNTGGTGSVACQTVEVYYAPNFTVKACSGGKVQVTIPVDSTTQRYDEFVINWGGGFTSKIPKSATTMVTSYPYPANTAAATISVMGSVAGQSLGCSKPAASVVLSTTNLSAVAIRKVTARADGLVDVLVKGSQGATAEIQVNDGSGTFKNTGQLMTTNDTTTITVRDIDANKNTYCFRLSANDGCDNAAVISNEVCSTNLDVVAQNRQNALSWKEYPPSAGFQNYRITRNGVNIGTALARTTNSTIDSDVVCGQQYCYQITVTLTNGVESVSALRCAKAISNETPSVVRNAFATVLEEEQRIEIRADLPATGTTPNYKTIFLRAENGSNDFKEVAIKNNILTFKDETVDPAAQSYCYKIQYENACGNRSEPTEPICSIRLYSKTNSTVDWTPETPFLLPVDRYDLEVIDEQGNIVAQEPLGKDISFDPNKYNPDQQLFRYRILAKTQNATRISYSNFYVFTRDAIVFIPDAFSPNGDNVNEKFAPKGQFMDKSRLIVYNRWGQVLFETANALDGWDGMINGQPAVEGTYVYRLEITDSLGKNFVKTGTMLLAR